LTETEELLKQTTGNEAVTDKGKRRRRGVLNFMRESGKIFFGTMDETEARYYNEAAIVRREIHSSFRPLGAKAQG
jgi:hypothetical protein